MRRLIGFLSAVALLALPAFAHAQTGPGFLLDFDMHEGTPILAGTVVNTLFQSPEGVTISGLTPFTNQVQVINNETPTNALDATFGSILVQFDTDVRDVGFDVFGTFDFGGNPFGITNASVQAFDRAGNLLATLEVDETSAAGLHYQFSQGGIASLLLPADAYFDNLSTVPEPGAVSLITAAAVLGSGLLLRRRANRG